MGAGPVVRERRGLPGIDGSPTTRMIKAQWDDSALSTFIQKIHANVFTKVRDMFRMPATALVAA
jgi:hypothetical protein